MIMLQNLLATMFQDRRKNYNHSGDHPMTFNRSVRKRLQTLIGCCGFILCCHIFCFGDSFSKTLENSEDHVSDPHPSARSMFTSNFVETKSTVHFWSLWRNQNFQKNVEPLILCKNWPIDSERLNIQCDKSYI